VGAVAGLSGHSASQYPEGEIAMMFRGTINLDYTDADANEHTRLRVALREDGWTQVETSAYVRETTNINDLWRGIALVAKQSAAIGILSAMTFHIQASTDFAVNVPITSTLNPQNALQMVLAKPYPQ
jgi:hypothetical protein